MLALGYTVTAITIAALSGDWAVPVNTALLILLALVQGWILRASKNERDFIAKQVEEVKEQVTPGSRSPSARTRKEDDPPWRQPLV